MNPDYSPQQIVSRLGITRRDWEHLKKTCPPPRNLATLDDPRFDEWSRRDFSGLLIKNMQGRRPPKPIVLDTPQHHDSEPISVYDALRRLCRKSPAYSSCLLGCDHQDNFALIGANGLYVALGKLPEAYRWLKSKLIERKAA